MSLDKVRGGDEKPRPLHLKVLDVLAKMRRQLAGFAILSMGLLGLTQVDYMDLFDPMPPEPSARKVCRSRGRWPQADPKYMQTLWLLPGNVHLTRHLVMCGIMKNAESRHAQTKDKASKGQSDKSNGIHHAPW